MSRGRLRERSGFSAHGPTGSPKLYCTIGSLTLSGSNPFLHKKQMRYDLVVETLTINTHLLMHKNTKLLPYERQEIFESWKKKASVASLARTYRVSRQTIYDTLRDARLGIFQNRSSMNMRYRKVHFGLKKLNRIELETRRKVLLREHRKNRYERTVPGELVHLDTKRMPTLRFEGSREGHEYLFVAIDDHSRWLFADIFPDKTAYSAAIFLEETKRAFPFKLLGIYSDNGSEFKGRPDHPVSLFCTKNKLSQAFTKIKHPWTNGKAERVIKTLMTEWATRSSNFNSRDQRRRYLYAYVDWYNQARHHLSLNSTPLERLEQYMKSVNDA